MEEAYIDLDSIKKLKVENNEEPELKKAIYQDTECLSAIKKAVHLDFSSKEEMEIIEIFNKLIAQEKNEDNDKLIEYNDNVFSKEDYFLYRGLLYFYLKNYNMAISDFEQCIKLKKELKSFYNESAPEKNENLSIETDLSDIGLCSINVHENQFNLILCYILV